MQTQGRNQDWENYTTGGHISAAIGEQDNGLSAYQILGTYRSMVNSNSYNSRGKDIYVLFHGSGRTWTKHTVCSVPWSNRTVRVRSGLLAVSQRGSSN